VEHIPKAPLLEADGKLVPKARQIFQEIFMMYSKDGFMDAEGAAAFVNGCLKTGISSNDRTIVDFMEQND